MKKKFFLFLALLCWQTSTHAADLLEVYQQALISDPVYIQAIAQRFSTRQGAPINMATLLPNILFNANPYVTRSNFAGTFLASFNGTTIQPRSTTTRGYTMTLSVTQTIFDFAKFARFRGALATSKGADATLNAALQDLMARVASAYFAVLRDEDNVSYSKASKAAYAEQLDQVNQQYKVGLKTLTDVYTAQASYDSASAELISAETQLTNDRENLRVITGKYYPHLSTLSEKFPLITPKPANIDQWVDVAIKQNWNIRASQYAVETAKQNVRVQIAGHLPTVDVQGKLDRIYQDNINAYRTLNARNGPGTETDKQVALNINVPIFSGGGVLASTNQAIYDYQVSQQKLEKIVRDTLNNTRQSYLGIIAGVSKIQADKLTIKSSISSLQGMEESYKVGTETLVNVLNQQEKVFKAQTKYATDRYKFVTDILALKQAAGTLSFADLCGINVWLTEKRSTYVRHHLRRK